MAKYKCPICGYEEDNRNYFRMRDNSNSHICYPETEEESLANLSWRASHIDRLKTKQSESHDSD